MPEEAQPGSAAQNKDQQESPKNEPPEKKPEGEAPKETTPEGGKGDADYYNKRLVDLEAEKKRLEEDHARYRREQTRAIDALKKENKQLKDSPGSDDDDDEVVELDGEKVLKRDYDKAKKIFASEFSKEREKIAESLREEIKRDFAGTRMDEILSRISSDPNERKLIRWHYENTVKTSGDIERDLKRARLHANEEVIFAEKPGEEKDHLREEILASFSGSRGGAGGSPSNVEESKIRSEAAELLKGTVAEGSIKNLQ